MITLHNFNKKYNDTDIFKQTNYTFKDCALTCFVGASGTGKTTLLNVIAGLDTAYTGDISINGVSLQLLTADERSNFRFNNIGFVFQHYQLLNGYTALENVLMGIHLSQQLSAEEKRTKAENLLIKVGLPLHIHNQIDTLSGGQKQRVAIARALMHDPSILLADEPTGALDRKTTKEIMTLLRDISKTKTVIVITHDDFVTAFADEVVILEDHQLKRTKTKETPVIERDEPLQKEHAILTKKDAFSIAMKNCNIHLIKYGVAALTIAIATAVFIAVLSSNNILNGAMHAFKEKNFFFHKGFIPQYHDGKKVNDNLETTRNELQKLNTVENIYYQYNLENLTLSIGDTRVPFPKKVPSNTSTISMVYGRMPNNTEKEIVLSPSLAKQFHANIQDCIGKTLTLTYADKQKKPTMIQLNVTGIIDGAFDNFLIGSSVEREIYDNTHVEKPFSISFDIKEFNDIVPTQKLLHDKNIVAFTKEKEVANFQNTFTRLLTLFKLVSYLVLIVGLAMSIAILYKIAIERYREVGLLRTLGYTSKDIRRIFTKEALLFSGVSTLLSLGFVKILDLFSLTSFGYSLGLTAISYVIVIGLTIFLTIGIPFLINTKLIKTEPAVALRK